MKTFSSLHDLWQHYFITYPKVGNCDAWSIVFVANDGNDLLVSLANPFTEEHDEVFVSNVLQSDIKLFLQHYKQRFLDTLQGRFEFYRPEVDSVLTEYPDWQTFYEAWLRDDWQFVQGNMPLLLDYPNALQYRSMQMKDADYAGYRRLLVVVYQFRKQRFQKVFIKAVDDEAFAAIKRQISDLYRSAMPNLLTPKVVQNV